MDVEVAEGVHTPPVMDTTVDALVEVLDVVDALMEETTDQQLMLVDVEEDVVDAIGDGMLGGIREILEVGVEHVDRPLVDVVNTLATQLVQDALVLQQEGHHVILYPILMEEGLHLAQQVIINRFL